MTKSSRQQREHLIEKFLIEKYGTKYIGEINNSARTNFCIAAFDFVGRKIEENWTYKNANQKIPFIYIVKTSQILFPIFPKTVYRNVSKCPDLVGYYKKAFSMSTISSGIEFLMPKHV